MRIPPQTIGAGFLYWCAMKAMLAMRGFVSGYRYNKRYELCEDEMLWECLEFEMQRVDDLLRALYRDAVYEQERWWAHNSIHSKSSLEVVAYCS